MPIARLALLAASLLTPVAVRHARASNTTVRMGSLKLIHSITPYFDERFMPARMQVEVIPFESPTDGKDAVAANSVDFGTFGIAAAIFAVVAHEPVVVVRSACNPGMRAGRPDRQPPG